MTPLCHAAVIPAWGLERPFTVECVALKQRLFPLISRPASKPQGMGVSDSEKPLFKRDVSAVSRSGPFRVGDERAFIEPNNMACSHPCYHEAD